MSLLKEPGIGDVLGGKYEVRGILGRGGMGVVLSAWHKELDRKVAIKCLVPQALAIPDVVERFAREARASAKIRGEHVVQVLDVGKFEDGTPFIVMEHLEGHDLSVELARRGRFEVSEAVRYVLETCEALAQSHVARIVHRDLKPSNLFLAETPGRAPIIKVLDFGISKVVDPDSDAITKTATVIGTAHYMSPEQLLAAKSVDERSDLWSLGIILYQLLVGQPPFTGESAPEIIAKIIKNTPKPPRALREEIPPGLEAVILRCLRTEPGERFVNVGELASALLPFAAPEDAGSVTAITRVVGESTRAVSVPPRAIESSPTPGAHAATPLEIASTLHEESVRGVRGRRRWVVGGIAGVAAIAALATALGTSRRAPEPAAIVGAVDAIASAPPIARAEVPSASAPSIVAPPPSPSSVASMSAAPARTPPAAPRSRPVASTPRPTPSASASASAPPTAAPSAATDPLDIPLR